MKIEDITTIRKKMEQSAYCNHLEQAFFQMDDKLRFVLDDKGTIIHINQLCTTVLGFEYDEIVGRCLFKLIIAEDESIWRSYLARIGRTEEQILTSSTTKSGKRVILLWDEQVLQEGAYTLCQAEQVKNML